MYRPLACVGLLIAGLGCEVPNPSFRSREDQQPDAARRMDASATSSKDAEAAVSLDLGLVGFWRMDDGAGTVARDSSGRGNHGTLSGLGATAWAAGRNGGHSIEFEPSLSTPRIEVPDSPSLDGIVSGVTMAAWVWPSSDPADRWRVVMSRQSGGTNAERYGLGWNGATLGLYLTAEQFGLGPRTSADAPLASWTHVAATYDGTVARLFMNGIQLVEHLVVTQTLGTDTTPLLIGNNRNATEFGEAWIGRLDDVLLYDRALAPHEVAALAAGALPSSK